MFCRGPKPDPDSKDGLCDTPDTVKLVSEERVPQRDAPPTVSISLAEKQLDDPEQDLNPRRLSTTSLIQTEDDKILKQPRRLSGPNAKLAEVPLLNVSQRGSMESTSEEGARGALAALPITGCDEVRARDSITDDKSGGHNLTAVSIPEELDDQSDGTSSPAQMSSSETLNDSREARRKKGKLNAPMKAENLSVFKAPFPGLRKDSIDIYKMKRQNQEQSRVESSEGRSSGVKACYCHV